MFEQEQEEDEYYSHQKAGSKTKYYLILFGVAGIYFFAFFRDVMFEVNAALMYMSYLILGVVALFSYPELMIRHKTPKVIAPGDYTTWSGDMEHAGDYVIIKREGMDATSFKWPGGGAAGVIIVPAACVNSMGPSLAITAQLINVPFDVLPDVVREKLGDMSIRLDAPMLFGLAAPEQYPRTLDDEMTKIKEEFGITDDDIRSLGDIGIKKPSVSHLVSTIKDQNRRITWLERLKEAKFKDMTGIVNVAGNIAERSAAAKAKGWLWDDKKEDKF